jgi:hypothetical protein
VRRWLVGAVGVLLLGYGGWLLATRQDPERVLDAAVWLGGGVLLHDLVLAPVVVLVGVTLARLLSGPARGPVVVGAVVLGSVTLLAVPVLGRFGARPDNPTLLDRPYWAGWSLLATLTVVAVAAGVAVVRSRQRRRSREGG